MARINIPLLQFKWSAWNWF